MSKPRSTLMQVRFSSRFSRSSILSQHKKSAIRPPLQKPPPRRRENEMGAAYLLEISDVLLHVILREDTRPGGHGSSLREGCAVQLVLFVSFPTSFLLCALSRVHLELKKQNVAVWARYLFWRQEQPPKFLRKSDDNHFRLVVVIGRKPFFLIAPAYTGEEQFSVERVHCFCEKWAGTLCPPRLCGNWAKTNFPSGAVIGRKPIFLIVSV